jgi:hypothetical protein
LRICKKKRNNDGFELTIDEIVERAREAVKLAQLNYILLADFTVVPI